MLSVQFSGKLLLQKGRRCFPACLAFSVLFRKPRRPIGTKECVHAMRKHSVFCRRMSVLNLGGHYPVRSVQLLTAELRCFDVTSTFTLLTVQRFTRIRSKKLSGHGSDQRAEQGARANDHGRHAACYLTSDRNETSDRKSSSRTRRAGHGRGSSLTLGKSEGFRASRLFS